MKRIGLLLLLVVWAFITKVEAGEIKIDFDQPDGNPWIGSGEETGLKWKPIQGQWNIKKQQICPR